MPCHLMIIITNKKQTKKHISNVLCLSVICIVCVLMDMLVNCVYPGGHVCCQCVCWWTCVLTVCVLVDMCVDSVCAGGHVC